MEAPDNNHPHKHFSPVSFVSGLLIALTVFFVLYKLVQTNTAAPKSNATNDSTKVETKIVEFKQEGIDFSEEHFHKTHHHRHIDRDAAVIVVSPEEMTALEKGNLSEQQKQILELLPNAPVIYIFDLKITDYQNLYFAMGEPLVLENKVIAGRLLHETMKDFSEQKFDSCFTKMTRLSFANTNDVNALFYGGMSAYYKKDFTQALVRFDKVANSLNNTFKQEAVWFKAMALLENNEKGSAKKILGEIVAGKGFYTARASEKLKEIK